MERLTLEDAICHAREVAEKKIIEVQILSRLIL